jgi:type II secretory pathway pseudopilin PulG
VKEFEVRRKGTGFTLFELLMTVLIISILIALLLPAFGMVRRLAKETEQKAQFNTIGLALEAFRSDYGDYPPTDFNPRSNQTIEWDYEGAQRLAEALVGLDMLGFHPDSEWNIEGEDAQGEDIYRLAETHPDYEENLDARRGPYLDNPSANVFRLRASSDTIDDGLFYPSLIPSQFDDKTYPSPYVICDVFKVRRITLRDPVSGVVTGVVKAGTPILYYRANLSSRTMRSPYPTENRYDVEENLLFYLVPPLADIDKQPSQRRVHRFKDNLEMFYNRGNEPYVTYKVVDPKVTHTVWPHRPDSYILISAGMDGLYGTPDDILNF